MNKTYKKEIPNDAVPDCYKIAKQVYEKRIRFTDGKNFLVEKYGIKGSSAADYLYNFRCLIVGKRLTRTLNAYSMAYFFENILKDYGTEVLRNALDALDEHIKYIKALGGGNLRSMIKIYKMYRLLINQSQDEIEQNEIIQEIEQSGISKSEILNLLKNLEEVEPEMGNFAWEAYKRDNKIIALIKRLRDLSCQLCGGYILKSDGRKYVEAAHIIAKHLKGGETLSNIILLCPNHHKEFDLGHLVILNHTKEILEINLNGSHYKIVFEI